MAIPLIGQNIPIIGKDAKERAQMCLKEIQKTLEHFDCVIIPVITIAGSKIISAMDIQAKPQKIPGRGDN